VKPPNSAMVLFAALSLCHVGLIGVHHGPPAKYLEANVQGLEALTDLSSPREPRNHLDDDDLIWFACPTFFWGGESLMTSDDHIYTPFGSFKLCARIITACFSPFGYTKTPESTMSVQIVHYCHRLDGSFSSLFRDSQLPSGYLT